MQLDGLYQEIILDHWKHPRGRGLREPYGGESHQVNPTCGDEVTVRVRLADGTVADLSYEGLGCSISQASASVLHEQVSGRPLAEALAAHRAFTELMGGRGQVEPDEERLGDAVAFAGVARYPARIKCALLAWVAFQDAVIRSGGTVDVAGGAA
jgi:nitrogen fixation NifU-like protein